MVAGILLGYPDMDITQYRYLSVYWIDFIMWLHECNDWNKISTVQDFSALLILLLSCLYVHLDIP